MKKITFLTAVSATALIVCGAIPAKAQQMDYGSLESLFGEPVTTSATGKPQRASEAPVNMEIVTADDIRRTGARTIPEALKGVTGVDVWQSGINSFDVGVRGSNAYYNPTVLVMVNGRQVYVDAYGYTSWSSIPVAMNEIRQIEVVKGPNTALFGFNAVAGVINIITYNPQFDKKDNLSVTAGTGTDYRGSLMKTFSIGEQSGVRVSVSRNESNEFGNGYIAGDQHLDNSVGRSVSIDGRFKIADKTTLALGASHDKAGANEINPSYLYSRNTYEVNSANIGLTQETENWGTIDFSAYHNALSNEIGGGLGVGFDMLNKVSVVKLQDLFKIGTNHTFRVAGEYRNNRIENILAGTGDLSYDVYSASGMWDWAIHDNVSWTNALRVDKLYLNRSGVWSASSPYSNEDYTKNLTAYSANSGLVYKATDKDTIGLNYGRGVQIPSLINFGALDFSLNGAYVGGRPDLNPTMATNYELDYTHNMNDLKIGASAVPTTFKAALFHKTFQDLTTLTSSVSNPSISPATFLYQNAGSSQSTGLELSLKGKVDTDWHWGANYTYETTNDTMVSDASGNPLFNIGYADSNPRHLANLNIGYSKDVWEADAALHYVSGRKMLRDTTPAVPFDNSKMGTDPVYGMSARIGYELVEGLTLSLSGSNLQSANSHQTSGPDVERAVWLGLSWDY